MNTKCIKMFKLIIPINKMIIHYMQIHIKYFKYAVIKTYV